MTPDHKQSGRAVGKPAGTDEKRQASGNAGPDDGKRQDESRPDAGDEGRGSPGHDSLLNPDLIRKMIIFAIVQAAVIIICAGALLLVYLFWIKPATPVIW